MEKIFKINGIDICTESFGKPTDPTVLLIMGAMCSMVYWDDEFCQRLADTGRYVIDLITVMLNIILFDLNVYRITIYFLHTLQKNREARTSRFFLSSKSIDGYP